MEQIPWVPLPIAARLRKELIQLVVTFTALSAGAIVAFLQSITFLMVAEQSFSSLTLGVVALILGSLSLFTLKILIERRNHLRTLIEEQEKSIAEQSLKLLAEIETTLN